MSNWQETDIGRIPSDWDYGCLLDVASKEKKAIISGPFGSNISRKYFVDEGVPVIRGNNLSLNIGQRFIDNDFVYVTQEKAEKLNTWATIDDLIFTAAGTIGQVGIITQGQKYKEYIISNKQLRVTIDSSKMLPIYAYYWFASNFMQFWIASCDTGSTIPLINLTVLKSLPVPIPPLPEQKAIASVLSSLDDKIDLLHRQNKTLEAMAENLFRQWFVEEAQDDWEDGSLLELIQLVGGGTPKTAIAEYWDGDIPWLSGGDIASNHKSFVKYAQKKITEVGLNNSAAKLLPKHATVISARGTVGKYCLLAQPMAFSQSNYGILPKNSEGYFFTYLLINHVVEELQSSAYGSVFDTITTTTFKENKVPLPLVTEIRQFDNSVSVYFEKMFLNQSQIQTLEKLRDTLLSKLMSGEVRVAYDKN